MIQHFGSLKGNHSSIGYCGFCGRFLRATISSLRLVNYVLTKALRNPSQIRQVAWEYIP